MKLAKFVAAGFIGLALTTTAFTPPASAQSLRVMKSGTSQNIKVSLNQAIVMESDQSFAELSVANPGVADVAALSDRTIYVLGKAPGRTTLTLLGADGRLITNVEVLVSPDLAEFKERLKEILPKEKIQVRTANDGIVLSGTVSGTQTLASALELANRYAPGRVTNLLSVGGTHQVMLKVRIAEMQRNVAKQLSSSLGFFSTAGRPIVGGTGQFNTGTNLNSLVNGQPITNTNQTAGSFNIGFAGGGLQLSILLEALETKGMVRTLAEPNLSAISGAEASFLAGGEFPVPVVEDGSVAIDYKPFGVQLNFKPVVLDDGMINLTIETEVSEIDNTTTIVANGLQVPAFKTRTAATTVEMRDGESLSIAGLLQDDFLDAATQVPWLGDIPILGALFRSSNFRRQQSELVIIVTPHLVTPVDGDTLVLPTDRIRLPSESELFLLGKTSGAKNTGRSNAAGSVAAQDYKGSYGYVLE